MVAAPVDQTEAVTMKVTVRMIWTYRLDRHRHRRRGFPILSFSRHRHPPWDRRLPALP